ncbi:unnamed protein product [Medioppia subpectinata]|uniref:Uncharacterized protein n=1 Tax=Medioppia subpectinata TaxID=1979941 RepID=A0A7R9KNY3_9ACAR|nr:unnamed protein product [Medioppia subpectinata]CAG2106070.1 unnamed protein product [Medioppia subpectinata]
MFAPIVVFGVSLVVVSSAVVTPVCRLSQFDSCFANLALNLNSFPENDVIFDELCLNLNETRKCAFQTAIRARSPSILCCALSRAQLCTDRALSTRCGESHARFFRQTLPLGEISQNLCQNSETKDCEKTLLIGLDVKSRDISTPFTRALDAVFGEK